MRIEVIKKEVYSYEDIIKEDNKNVLDNILEKWDSEFFHDFIIEEKIEMLESLGYNDCTIYYNGFYNQGDGACFICENIDIEKIIKRHDFKIKFGLQDFFINQIENKKITHSGRYYHENSINFQGYYCSNEYSNIDNYLEKVFLEIEKIINKEIKELSRGIYKTLENEYIYQNSKEYIIDMILNNDYEFYENGEMV